MASFTPDILPNHIDRHRYNISNKTVAFKWKYYLKLIILVIDEQQNSNKQGLTPSPSSAFSSSNVNDSTIGMKFLMVPGQNAQTGSFSSGKHITFDVHATFIGVVVNMNFSCDFKSLLI